MKIAWATDVQGIGDAYGYTQGNRWGRRCLEMAGVQMDPAAPLALHHCPPHAFRPIPGRCNVLWTAWEFPELPEWETATLGGADAVFVTARFLVPVFKKLVPVPVLYVPQGVDVENFYPAPRPLGKRAFRVLWVGAPNDRKGYKFLLGAWRAYQDVPGYELYMKTTGTNRLERFGNVIFDSRDIGIAALRELYQSADLFAFPSMGEGFGFTLGEAMACGLPALYTPCTSLLDLADERCAIPLRAETGRKFRLLSPRGDRDLLIQAAEPNVTDLAERILWAREHPRRIEKIGRRAADHIRRRFTWTHTSLRLLRALREIQDLRSGDAENGPIAECGLRIAD